MSVEVGFDPRASAEIEEASVWYEGQRAGLGREFVAEVRAAVFALGESSGVGSPLEGADPALEIRRVGVRRFPYQVVYVVHEDAVVVIAVAHDRRRSDYWGQRLESSE